MRVQLRFALFIGFLSLLLIGNAYAKPSYSMDCSLCHIAPTVTNFELPASHDALTVPITGFNAADTDDQVSSLARVAGYMVTASSTAPGSNDPGWQPSPPASYTFASDGLQTLYAWVKDAVGIVSSAASDTVEILLAVNAAPVADAGPDQTVDEGTNVVLNGSNSDDSDDGIKSFYWEQVGTANPVTLSDPNAEQPSFTAPDVGPEGVALTFRLTVTDNSDETDSDTCIVNVSWVNIAPIADAGDDQTVLEGTTVVMDGSASDGVDDNIASYLWEQVDVTGSLAVLSDPTAVNPEFTLSNVNPDGESLTFQLTVTDEGGLQASDRCVVNITNVNQAPVAEAGDDQVVATGAGVTLDASDSYDPEGGTLTYLWKQIAGTSVTLTSPSAFNPSFTAPGVDAGTSETLTFELTVTDSGQLQATDTCDIQVDGEDLPPTEDPPAEEPPTEDPPAEDPPAECPDNAKSLEREYSHLYRKYSTSAKIFERMSERLERVSRRVSAYDTERAQIYKTRAQNLAQLSQENKLEAEVYKTKLDQVRTCLQSDEDEDHHRRWDRDRDEDDRDDDDDERDYARDRDRKRDRD